MCIILVAYQETLRTYFGFKKVYNVEDGIVHIIPAVKNPEFTIENTGPDYGDIQYSSEVE